MAPLRKLAPLLVLCALAAPLAACGEKSEPQFDQSAPASAGRAAAEIPALKVDLQQALAAYEAGHPGAARASVEKAGDTGFAIVQGPLEELDASLSASIERLLGSRIPDAMRAGAPRRRVQALVGQAQSELDRAADELRRAS